eukprot:TRINITY_DN480_c0_g1_i3.p1 TRINITY_DN480_c0_g1~~TRINITY_DN480_c0_g1_i3.p1  ORF type:complete len:167 (+),score=27.25 TRINITY_DN480_c0_g1_i3:360-860(+)
MSARRCSPTSRAVFILPINFSVTLVGSGRIHMGGGPTMTIMTSSNATRPNPMTVNFGSVQTRSADFSNRLNGSTSSSMGKLEGVGERVTYFSMLANNGGTLTPPRFVFSILLNAVQALSQSTFDESPSSLCGGCGRLHVGDSRQRLMTLDCCSDGCACLSWRFADM